MDFLIKKTTELSAEEKRQINALFNQVFEKNRTLQEFDNQFLNNPLGYSYHSLMVRDGKIVGHNSGIPSYYMVDDKRELFFNNVDTMILKECRGIDNFFDLISNATDRYTHDGAMLFYGFPNDNSYPVLSQTGLMEDVGKLDTYCLPVRIGGIKKGMKILNPLSQLFCAAWLGLASTLASSKVAKYRVEKELETYNLTRYKRSDGKYSFGELPDGKFVYKIMDYEGVRTAFLIDVWPKSAKNFTRAIKQIKKKEGSRFDLLLYVGHLPFSNHGMIKFPRKFEPKHFNFTALLLNGDRKDVLFNIDNWDVNLSNYDLL